MYAYYPWIKLVHISCVTLSVSLFAARGLWLLGAGRPLGRGLRVVPHIIDTLLLVSGLTLAFLIHQYPFVNSAWLTAKVIGLLAYIVLGMTAFRGRVPHAARWALWCVALLVFGYIVSVAVSKQPAGFLAGI
jgi:uncharacterized membrane protein SirB2